MDFADRNGKLGADPATGRTMGALCIVRFVLTTIFRRGQSGTSQVPQLPQMFSGNCVGEPDYSETRFLCTQRAGRGLV